MIAPLTLADLRDRLAEVGVLVTNIRRPMALDLSIESYPHLLEVQAEEYVLRDGKRFLDKDGQPVTVTHRFVIEGDFHLREVDTTEDRP